MLDIVNAGYQRRTNNRHIAHIANRYQCLVSDDESDNDDNIKPTNSTSDSLGITTDANDLSPLILASIDLTSQPFNNLYLHPKYFLPNKSVL